MTVWLKKSEGYSGSFEKSEYYHELNGTFLAIMSGRGRVLGRLKRPFTGTQSPVNVGSILFRTTLEELNWLIDTQLSNKLSASYRVTKGLLVQASPGRIMPARATVPEQCGSINAQEWRSSG